MTEPATPERLWAAWRSLRRLFPMWSLPWSTVATPGALSMMGNDFVSGLRRNRNTAQAALLLAAEPRDLIDALSDLADLNVRRQEQVFRAAFILYVTLPFAGAAAWSDVAPDSLKAWIAADPQFIVQFLGAAGAGIALYWLGLWRAKQMVSVLALIRIERGYGLTALATAEAEA